MAKTILITGASRGIGAQIALDAASAGYNVAINYNNSFDKAVALRKTITDKGAQAELFKADVSDLNDIDRMFEEIGKAYGGIDILVNNAGVECFGQIQDITKEQLTKTFNTNIVGAVYICSKAAAFMISKKFGRIVNISSVWGLTGGSCESVYSASKSAFSGFTKALSKELAPSGITVNCIAPGIIETDMNLRFSVEEKNNLRESVPVGRLGLPKDISRIVLNLITDDASYITGQIITVDGGYAI